MLISNKDRGITLWFMKTYLTNWAHVFYRTIHWGSSNRFPLVTLFSHRKTICDTYSGASINQRSQLIHNYYTLQYGCGDRMPPPWWGRLNTGSIMRVNPQVIIYKLYPLQDVLWWPALPIRPPIGHSLLRPYPNMAIPYLAIPPHRTEQYPMLWRGIVERWWRCNVLNHTLPSNPLA